MTSTLSQNTEYLENLQKMFTEIQTCFIEGTYGIQCAAEITQKYIRKLDFMKKLIYPWRNYDWEYTEFVKKNYNPQKLQVSGDGTVTAIIRDVDALLKIIEGLLFDANPDDVSSASNPASSKNDLVDCLNQSGGLSCRILNAAKMSYLSQKAPYKNSFFNKPLEGKYSSSYYVQVGMCPSNITDQTECENKGYQWTGNPLSKLPGLLKGPTTKSGSCFKGKYAYIDNKPGYPIGNIKDLNGLIPSIANNMVSINPENIMATAMGINTPSVSVQDCNESFTNRKDLVSINKIRKTNNYLSIFLIITYFILIIYLGFKLLH